MTTQEDKELLLRDLCARLPYGVKLAFHDLAIKQTLVCTLLGLEPFEDKPVVANTEIGSFYILSGSAKPYLFPMSSMTEEEQRTLDSMCYGVEMVSRLSGLKMFDKAFDWLNENHFDYRGLIEKRLAIDATKLNIY